MNKRIKKKHIDNHQEYLLKSLICSKKGNLNYYLFNDFDKAHNKMKELSNAYIFEPILFKSIFESIGKE
jgi:hypothetical protein